MYSTMSSLSNISVPVFGSTRNGTVIRPVRSCSSDAKPALAPGQGRRASGRSSSSAASRTFRQKGEPSYSYSTSGSSGRTASASSGEVSRKATGPRRKPYVPDSTPTAAASSPVSSQGVQPSVNTPVASRTARASPPVISDGSCSLGRVIESGFGLGATKPAGAATAGGRAAPPSPGRVVGCTICTKPALPGAVGLSAMGRRSRRTGMATTAGRHRLACLRRVCTRLFAAGLCCEAQSPACRTGARGGTRGSGGGAPPS
mmetsp:Transcript_44510/g.141216  ORF Transcript_44510/g.141216 Transcript_44510/m.141216 type:complete len:259 (+) Transcript_44510:664-1440(+)